MPEAVVNIWKSDKKAMEITLKLVTGNSIKFLVSFFVVFPCYNFRTPGTSSGCSSGGNTFGTLKGAQDKQGVQVTWAKNK